MFNPSSHHGVPALPFALLALMMLAACGQTGTPPAAAPSGTQGWRANYTFDYQDGRITQADLQYA